MRISIGVGLIAAAGLLPAVGPPQPTAAACGTNWKSEVEPPESILVLRTATGKVEEVGLKKYVAVVMASGEWPSSLPVALLEAGALATKQYGWYYTLKGNHRESYVNGAGHCYDVRDDSDDQIYRPESSQPTDKQRAARDALWGLSLRKKDDFFLTGYRQGSATECAKDANEWKLYAKSAEDCAKRLEYDSLEILHAYYSPKLTEVWAPGSEPEGGSEDQDVEEGQNENAGAESGEEESGEEVASGAIRSVVDWFSSLFGGDAEA